MAPDSSLIVVKLDASIALSPSAKRQSTEFAAKAINAKDVNIVVLIKCLLIVCTLINEKI